MRKCAWSICYMLLLIFFTIYIALDTFVISRVDALLPLPSSFSLEEEPGKAENSTPNVISPEAQYPIITENVYKDENIHVTLTQHRAYDTTIYVAEVLLSDIGYLKTALAQNAYGRNITEKTPQMAKRTNAILAINGDYYGVRERGHVLRNGHLYRNLSSSGREALVIYTDGSFEIVSEEEITAEALMEAGANQVFSFGSGLVEAGVLTVQEGDEVGKAMASNPRTAIGIVEPLHYFFVVSDGRTQESNGLSLYQLAEFMQELGAVIAYNLDGGGSSTLYFNGQMINNPTTNGRSIRERGVSDIVFIGY